MLSSQRGLPLTYPQSKRYTPDQTKVGQAIPPKKYVVSFLEVKQHLPVRVDTNDPAIAKLIDSVTAQVEAYIRQDVVKKSVKSFWFSVPPVALLPRGPHGDITLVQSINSDNETTTLVEGVDFRVEGMTYKRLVSIHASGALAVTFESGYEQEDIPPQVPQAVLQEIALQYKNRQDPDTPAMTSVGSLSLEARHLLSSLMRRSY